MKNTYVSKSYDRIMYGIAKFLMWIVGVGAALVAVSVIVS